MISVPETTSIINYIATLFTELWIFIALIIGIPLAFYVIEKVLSLFRTDDGTTSRGALWIYRRNKRLGAWIDRKTYKKYKLE